MFLEKPYFAVSGKNAWTLTKACVYASPLLDCTIRVPVGFETDLASIPAFFTRVLPINDKHRLAAVVHDYLYSVKGRLPNKNITRRQADEVFYEAMVLLKVPFWKRWAMFQAVRAGGWTRWKD